MNIYRGIGVSDGVAIGKVLMINSAFMQYPRIELDDDSKVPIEIDRIRQAQLSIEEQLDQTMAQSTDILPEEMRSVFVSYKLFIRDKRFVPAIEKRITRDKINAEWALIHVMADLEKQFKQIQDPYIRSRFNDIRQLGERLMNSLLQKPFLDLTQLKHQVIIVCHDISPADSFHLAKANILGIITELGGMASHTSILARAMNIPAVVGLQDATLRLIDDDLIILDGNSGEVIDHPSDEAINEKLNKLERISFYQNQLQKLAEVDCELSDGRKIDLAANIDFLTELKQIGDLKIPSVGLIRTEFLFLMDESFPDEEEQLALYKQIIEAIDYKPVTIRTWDIGGDKPSKVIKEYMDEANPALGLRAIRVCLKYDDLFRIQIRAILRASENSQINLMIPMVTRIDEVLKTKKIIVEELQKLNVKADNLQIGCMIETPASIFIIDELLDQLDFVSIGSNDLIQYALAVDRMNEHVADLFNPFHPAILSMLEKVVISANRMNKDVSICGELAADPVMQMFLIGVGEVTFSMSPNHILQTKKILKKVDTATCKKIAFQFMNKHSFEESNQYVQQLKDQYLEEITD
ncbi:MAG: phosphoenolpyruvate--protein phosphotransferase [Calditrichaeota bacterium]|jgi:phosphoenolpyruvate-protein phosphotransferase (PTS system enzyme I)|nr:phosphoenolpyruvate--protein phosphotransferase [Deltaproteobacteria bacterium]MBT7617569.1 phosphoenolpyruvate--protein phosphotransferase [Calditrichota bacterium]MBT4089234.1 phosphoenolpyruvate--protein phosphotransferase [Deltaproteobacteria bacterium]MBT4266258.1 phosphoenolpyruvate--protein phosphotransferase [Deltaproteobacteria bacterium]MBT4639969.1 phosphoenolpyruvate--protein phosphotransferase [Deltaproteobacteria bacterium]